MTSENEVPATGAQVTNFIRNIIDDDLARGANLPPLLKQLFCPWKVF